MTDLLKPAKPAKPARLFLADHLLRNVVGHHLGYNMALADAAARREISPCLVTHRAFDLSLAPGVACRKLFHTDFRAAPPAGIARNHRLLRLLEMWCDWQFGRDLRKFSGVGDSDAVFAQMLAPRHFLQWLRWMSAQPSPPVLILQLGYRPERFAAPGIAAASGRLARGIRERVLFVTDSEKLIGPFEENLGRQVHYLPHILSYDFPRQPPGKTGKPHVLFAPGNARREKGFAEIVSAIRTVSRSGARDDFHFMVQHHDPDPVCAEVLRKGLPSGVEAIDRPLEDREYVEHLNRADVVLLPYHLDLYERRTSGIFCEARVAGKPVIATEKSWAGDRVRREGGGWLVQERDAASLVACLQSLPETFAQKAAEAGRLRQQAFDEFHREGFLTALVGLFQKGAQGGH
ncbi:MAG: glycosyltransferase [Chthoniobacterales bacterium]|nr:glycosyltransferase [Chthoniobacterales bacterium]